jgi:ketosteroid isomerase-like protein
MSEANVELICACFAAFDRGDLRGAVEFTDASVEWDVSHVLLDQDVIVGRDAVLEYLEQTFRTLPFKHQQHRFLGAGKEVCVLASVYARGSASGVELGQPVGYVMTVGHGKIIRSRFFGDQAQALKAAGLAG